MSETTIGKFTLPQFAKAFFQYFGITYGQAIGFDHNGRLKNVTVTKAAVGLGNVDNTADADKPISNDVQAAFDALNKESVGLPNVDNTADAAKPISNDVQAAFNALTKTSVGLANVDNTADAAKPVSTAMQTALNAKQNSIEAQTHIADVTGGIVQDLQARTAIATILNALEATGIVLPT